MVAQPWSECFGCIAEAMEYLISECWAMVKIKMVKRSDKEIIGEKTQSLLVLKKEIRAKVEIKQKRKSELLLMKNVSHSNI